jgi:hypothetical protein
MVLAKYQKKYLTASDIFFPQLCQLVAIDTIGLISLTVLNDLDFKCCL